MADNLTCNVSFEYEKTEVNSGFLDKSAENRDKLVTAERRFIEDRVQKIIELKKKLCTKESGKIFVLSIQKGVLNGRFHQGRLDGSEQSQYEEHGEACRGCWWSCHGRISSQLLKQCASVTILIKGPNKHRLQQTRDGPGAFKNAIECYPSAGVLFSSS